MSACPPRRSRRMPGSCTATGKLRSRRRWPRSPSCSAADRGGLQHCSPSSSRRGTWRSAPEPRQCVAWSWPTDGRRSRHRYSISMCPRSRCACTRRSGREGLLTWPREWRGERRLPDWFVVRLWYPARRVLKAAGFGRARSARFGRVPNGSSNEVSTAAAHPSSILPNLVRGAPLPA